MLLKHDEEGRELEFDESMYRRRLNPQSVLPPHLQKRSFDDDVWMRVIHSPLDNPTLRENKLEKDAADREVIRQVLAAANEREKEVLLHNQARLFQEVLGRSLDAMRVFLSTPWLPPAWRSNSPAPRKLVENALPAKGEKPKKKGIGHSVLVVLEAILTPKYLLLALTAIFAVTSIYSRLQVDNLKKAIASYQEATSATSELKEKLSEALASSKDERERLQAQLAGANSEVMQAQTSSREIELQLVGLSATKKSLEDQVQSLQQELKVYREKGSDDIKQMQTRLDDSQKLVTDLGVAKGKLEEQLKTAQQEKRTGEEQQRELSDRVAELQKQIDTLLASNQAFANQNALLQRDKTLLSFARTCLANIRRDANSWGQIDKDKVKQFLQTFDDAEKTVSK